MTLEELLAIVNGKMQDPAPAPEPATATAPARAPESTPTPAPEPKPTPAPSPDSNLDLRLKNIETQLTAIQKANMQAAQQNGPAVKKTLTERLSELDKRGKAKYNERKDKQRR